MLSKFGVSFFQDLEGGELTSQPTIEMTCRKDAESVSSCQAVDMHGHGALLHLVLPLVDEVLHY